MPTLAPKAGRLRSVPLAGLQSQAGKDVLPRPSGLASASPCLAREGGEAGPSPRPIPVSRHSGVGRGGPRLQGRARTEAGAAPVPSTQFFVTQINRVILVRASPLSHALAAPCQPSREDRQARHKDGGRRDPPRGQGFIESVPCPLNQCPTSMSPSSSSAPKPEKLMGWQLRSCRLTRQAVCVVLKAGTVTSRTCCPSSPAKTGGRRADEPPVGTPARGPSPEPGSGGAAGCGTHL